MILSFSAQKKLMISLVVLLLVLGTACKFPSRISGSQLHLRSNPAPAAALTLENNLAASRTSQSHPASSNNAANFDAATLANSTSSQAQLDHPTTDSNALSQPDSPPEHSEVASAHLERSIPDQPSIQPSAQAFPSSPAVESQPLSAPISTASTRSLPTQSQRLIIKGVREKLGPVKVAIYTKASDFPNPASATKTMILPANQSELATTLEMPCSFAIAVYQDINSDGDLNRNKLGIPVEPFAFSNNAMGKRGPPTFDQAIVPVPANNTSSQYVIISLP